MKLKVELMWYGGLVVEGDDDSRSGAEYYLVDADTGEPLGADVFGTSEELEAYIAAQYPGVVRWMPPPPPPEEAARLKRFLEMFAGGQLDNPHLKHSVRDFLINQLYQSGYPDATVARIRTVIECLKN